MNDHELKLLEDRVHEVYLNEGIRLLCDCIAVENEEGFDVRDRPPMNRELLLALERAPLGLWISDDAISLSTESWYAVSSVKYDHISLGDYDRTRYREFR